MTLGSATLVRTGLAGAVVCLIAVGITAPALAGSEDDAPCPDPGLIETLLEDEECAEDPPAPALTPGSLLNPEFPDFPDYPGLPEDEDGEDDEGDGGSDGDSDENSDGDSGAGDEDGRSESEDGESDSENAGAGSGSNKNGGDSDGGDSDGADEDGEADPVPSAEGAQGEPAAETAAAPSGADTAVGTAVLPGVGDAIAGAESPGLDWTGALTPGRDSGPDDPPAPPAPDRPAPVARVDPPPPLTPVAPPAPAALAPTERTADLAAVTFATALPSPVETRWDLAAVLPSLALTLLLLAALALPVGLLNRAAAEQPDRVESLLARLRVPPGVGRPAPGAFLTAVAITAVAGAVLLGFLTPAFPFDTSAPALLVGLVVAFLVVTAAQQGTQLLYVTRWWGVRCHVGPVPGFLLLGAISVVLSRSVGLEPGLVLGILVAFRTARPLRTDEEGPAVALAATALTAVGGLAWTVRESLVGAAGAPGTFLADAVATALTATAVSAAANLVFALVPLAFLPGAALLRWSPVLWALFACTGGFAFVHLAMPPAADAVAGRAGVLAVVLAVYLLLAGGLWAWLRHGVDLSTGRLTVVPRR
jgi:hypothetical protein